MKRENIDMEFLLNGMLKSKDGDINISEEVKNEINNFIEFNDLDEDEKDVYESALQEMENVQHDDTAYDIYCALPYFEYFDDEPIVEMYNRKKQYEKEREEIERLADNFLKIINQIEGDFEIEFSEKSPSIYIKTSIPATKENVAEMYDDVTSLFSLTFSFSNVYEEDENYDENENIEVRLSDHDFGGYTRFDGYGDYVSYRHSCINAFYKF